LGFLTIGAIGFLIVVILFREEIRFVIGFVLVYLLLAGLYQAIIKYVAPNISLILKILAVVSIGTAIGYEKYKKQRANQPVKSICPNCGNVYEDSPQNQRYTCLHCGMNFKKI